MPTTAPTKGARRGLRLNPDALDAILGDRSRAWLAHSANLTPAHITQMVNKGRGASDETAAALAAVLNVRPGALFPELAPLKRQVRKTITRQRYVVIDATEDVA
jgi:regulator of extracellular matrix RemA (YlzA/DUF370 family)